MTMLLPNEVSLVRFGVGLVPVTSKPTGWVRSTGSLGLE